MTHLPNGNEMKNDRDFELSEIYDDDCPFVYRMGEEAITIFAQRSVCIIRPWHWLPGDHKVVPEAPANVVDGVRAMLEAKSEWEGTVSLGELVLWSSRRSRRDDWLPPEDDDTPMFVVARSSMDPQRVGNRIFNRRLIREACQAFIEDWAEGESSEAVSCSIRAIQNGSVLRLQRNSIQAFIMCLSDSVEAGSERMPCHKCKCQWEAGDSPCPVHGEDEEAQPLEAESRKVEPVIVWHPSLGDEA